MYQIFSFFDINKAQGLTVGLTDLSNIELHDDNLKQMNLAWDEMLLHLDSGFEEMVESFSEGQL